MAVRVPPSATVEVDYPCQGTFAIRANYNVFFVHMRVKVLTYYDTALSPQDITMTLHYPLGCRGIKAVGDWHDSLDVLPQVAEHRSPGIGRVPPLVPFSQSKLFAVRRGPPL